MAECEAQMSYVLSKSNWFIMIFMQKSSMWFSFSLTFLILYVCAAALCFYFFSVIFNGTLYVLSHYTNLKKKKTQAIWAELFWYDFDCAYLKQLDSL